MTFTGGVRYYNIDMDTYSPWFETGKAAPAPATFNKKQRETGWFPSFKLDVQATQDTALYAAISRAMRLPCLCDYYWWAQCATPVNPQLKPETAWEYETGIIQNFKPPTLRGTFYYYNIQNFMNDSAITAPGTGLGTNCLYNIPSVKMYGVELEAAIDFKNRFRGMVSYNYQAFDAQESPFQQNWSYYLPLLYPKHKVKMMGRVRLWEDGWLQANIRYVSARHVQKQAAGKLMPYDTLDVGFEQKFRFWQQELTVNAFANNLTGTRYQEIQGYYMPRQTFGVIVGTKF